MTQFLPFVYDTNCYLTNQKCFIITGNLLAYLTALLTSSLFMFCFYDNFPTLGTKGRELSKIFFDKIPLLQVSKEINEEFAVKVESIQNDYTKEKSNEIDSMIYELYQLTSEEIAYIERSIER